MQLAAARTHPAFRAARHHPRQLQLLLPRPGSSSFRDMVMSSSSPLQGMPPHARRQATAGSPFAAAPHDEAAAAADGAYKSFRRAAMGFYFTSALSGAQAAAARSAVTLLVPTRPPCPPAPTHTLPYPIHTGVFLLPFLILYLSQLGASDSTIGALRL